MTKDEAIYRAFFIAFLSDSPEDWANGKDTLVSIKIPARASRLLQKAAAAVEKPQTEIESDVFNTLILRGLQHLATEMLAEPEESAEAIQFVKDHAEKLNAETTVH